MDTPLRSRLPTGKMARDLGQVRPLRLFIFLERITPWRTVSVGGPIPPARACRIISAHGDEAETAEAKKIIEMERLMEEEDVKCFVVMAADAPLASRVSRTVSVLAPVGAAGGGPGPAPPVGTESDKHLFPESCLQNDWTDDYAKSEAFAAEYRAVTDPDDGQKWPKGLTEEDGKLYRNGKLLVPESWVLEPV